MRHATMLAFPSYGPESLSRVLIEAAALGAPIAAMDTGGTRDIIQHAGDGPSVVRRRRLRPRSGGARRGRAPSARARSRGAAGRARALLGDVGRRARGTGVPAVARARRGLTIPMTRPLSVAIVARAVMPLHGVGGLERSVHDLVRHLAARGVDVTMIVPPAGHVQRPTNADPFASQHVRIRHVRYLSFPFANRRGTTVLDRSTSYLLYGWRAGRLARSLANEGVVDLVHGFGASVLGASDGMMAPLVMNPQGLEEFGATAGSLPPLKHAGYAPLRWAVRHVASRAACIIATDVSLEPTVVRHLKPAAGQMRTIPNGIDLVVRRSARRTSRRAAHETAPRDRHRRARVRQRRPARIQQGVRPDARRARAGERTRQHARGNGLALGGRRRRAVPRRDRTAGRRPSSRTPCDLRRPRERARSPRLVRSGERVRPPDALRRQLARDAGSHGASPASDCDRCRRAA